MKKLTQNLHIANIRAARRFNGWKGTDWCCCKGNAMSLPVVWYSKPHPYAYSEELWDWDMAL